MQSLGNSLHASFQSSVEGSQLSGVGGESFLREFQAFQATVIGENPIDSCRFSADVYSQQNDLQKVINEIPENAIANNFDEVDSADQLDDFTDLEEDSLEPIPPDTDDFEDYNGFNPNLYNHTLAAFSAADNRHLMTGSNHFMPNIHINNNNSDSDLEVVNPQKMVPSALEDPIETYDNVVAQMTSAGVEWVPPDQRSKKTAHVRWFAPEVEESYTVEPVTIASDTFPQATVVERTTAKKTDLRKVLTPSPPPTSVIQKGAIRPSPPPHQGKTVVKKRQSVETKLPVTSTSVKPVMATIKNTNKLVANGDHQPLSIDSEESRLRNQLLQEQATRKQQDDYIQQLQKYYDNLLAKHAAAEQTIDHLRFRAKVDPSESNNVGASGQESGMSSRYGSRSQLSSVNIPSSGLLRRSKILSASADVFNRSPHQQLVNQSLISLAAPQPPRRQASLSRDAISQKLAPNSQSTQLVHLSASVGQLANSQNRTQQVDMLYGRVPSPSTAFDAPGPLRRQELTHNNHPRYPSAVVVNGEKRSPSPIVLSSQNGTTGGVAKNGSSPSLVQFAGADVNVARSLEEQMFATLEAINERVIALEDAVARGQLLPRQCDEMVAELTRELTEGKRKYHAGQFLWSSIPHGFDANTGLKERFDELERRLQVTEERRPSASLDETVATKQQQERPMSSDSAVFSGTIGSSSQVRLSPIFTPPELKVASSSSTFSSSAREAAEMHFLRLLSRYNELKKSTWHTNIVKDLESLMQRMLQLSERYSQQSSMISPPKVLRRMFELDYETNRLNEPLGKTKVVYDDQTNKFVYSQSGTELDTHNGNPVSVTHQTTKSIILTPDSGLSTPAGNTSAFSSKKAETLYDYSQTRGAFTRQYSGKESITTTQASLRRLHVHSIDTNATDGGIGSGSEVPYLSSDTRSLPNERKAPINPFRSHGLPEEFAGDACAVVNNLYTSTPASQMRLSTTSDDPHNQKLNTSNHHDIYTYTGPGLPQDVMHLEEDIRQLRQGIARLTHLSSISPSSSPNSGKARTTRRVVSRNRNSDRGSPCQFVESGGILPAHTSARRYTQQTHPSKRVFGSNSRPNPSRPSNYTVSSSSSEEELCRQQNTADKHHFAGDADLSTDSSEMQVIGSALRPNYPVMYPQSVSLGNPRPVMRTYQQQRSRKETNTTPNSIRPIKRKSKVVTNNPTWMGSMPSLDMGTGSGGCEVVRVKKKVGKSKHARSQSSTGGERHHRVYALQKESSTCNSCYGSGVRLNETVEHGYSTLPVSHGHTRSDPHAMPLRVIYEYGQPSIPVVMSSVRLPIRDPQNEAWGERVYGMREFEEQGVFPSSEFRAYKTLGHQPTFRQCLHDRKGADRQFHAAHLSFNSSQIPNDHLLHRMSRSAYQYDDIDDSSSSNTGYHGSHVAAVPSFNRPRRPTSLCRQGSPEDVDAYATAKSVTEMAQRLHSKLTTVHTPAARKTCYCDRNK